MSVASQARPATPVPTPFRFRAATALGQIEVLVAPGRVARLRCPAREEGGIGGLVPLDVLGDRMLVVAEAGRSAQGWSFLSLVASSAPGSGPARIKDGLLRRLIAEAVFPVLDAELRRFVERDIVELYRARREHEAAMAALQAQVDRRLEKMRLLGQAQERVEAELLPRESALRAELAGLGDGAPTGAMTDRAA